MFFRSRIRTFPHLKLFWQPTVRLLAITPSNYNSNVGYRMGFRRSLPTRGHIQLTPLLRVRHSGMERMHLSRDLILRPAAAHTNLKYDMRFLWEALTKSQPLR